VENLGKIKAQKQKFGHLGK